MLRPGKGRDRVEQEGSSSAFPAVRSGKRITRTANSVADPVAGVVCHGFTSRDVDAGQAAGIVRLAPASLSGCYRPAGGLGAGGALIAPLGDRFGRRALIVGGCFATGLFTLATSTANTISEFLIWRLLTGLALGACLPNVSALSAELAPPRLRATIMAVVSAGIPVGLALAGFLAPEIIAQTLESRPVRRGGVDGPGLGFSLRRPPVARGDCAKPARKNAQSHLTRLACSVRSVRRDARAHAQHLPSLPVADRLAQAGSRL